MWNKSVVVGASYNQLLGSVEWPVNIYIQGTYFNSPFSYKIFILEKSHVQKDNEHENADYIHVQHSDMN